ncbi:carbohydrate kinase [Zhihengliuella sp.]|uniref:carbohydrate kinase family protein n=1 Tax=Zhihengliuella sp. TaxID=1954483 RepID=UPI0028109FA1|nr:carbohydrate kinase [Zhihengliuella sp.]
MSRFLVVGEALIDVVRSTDGRSAEHPGGSPANVALGLGRLGQRVELVTWIGEDARGQAIRAHLEESGVGVHPASYSSESTSVAIATLNDGGAADYEFDVRYQLPRVEIGNDVGWVHTGSIAAVDGPSFEATADLLERAQVAGAVITYDPNLRPSLMGEPADVRPRVERLVGIADVVKVSDEDLEWLRPGQDPAAVAAEWADGGRIVVVTRGGDGVLAVHRDGTRLEVPAPRVDVVDTVGAGDSFMGGLLDGLARHAGVRAGEGEAEARSALERLGVDDLRAILERCVRIAAITVSRAGANPPGLGELEG